MPNVLDEDRFRGVDRPVIGRHRRDLVAADFSNLVHTLSAYEKLWDE